MIADLLLLAGLACIAFALYFIFKVEVKVGEEIVNNEIQDVKANLGIVITTKMKSFFTGLFNKTTK